MFEFKSNDQFRHLILKQQGCYASLDVESEIILRDFELIDSDKVDKSKELADFPNFYSRGILMSERAKNVLSETFDGCGIWVKMRYQNINLWYFFVNKYISAIDTNKSEFLTFEGQVVDIQKLALKEVNSTIFKLKEYPRRFPIINRETHKLIKENNLIGLTFKAIEVS
jgi:hypothetical protein